MLRRGIRHLCLENWATNLENWATNVPVPGATTAFVSFHPIRVQRPPSSCHRISCGQTKGPAKPFLQMGWPQDPWMSPWGQGRGCASALWGGEGGSCSRACFHEKPEVCLCPGCGNAPGAASPAPAGPEGGAGQCCQLGGGAFPVLPVPALQLQIRALPNAKGTESLSSSLTSLGTGSATILREMHSWSESGCPHARAAAGRSSSSSVLQPAGTDDEFPVLTNSQS